MTADCLHGDRGDEARSGIRHHDIDMRTALD
jgi:hypothetical protein